MTLSRYKYIYVFMDYISAFLACIVFYQYQSDSSFVFTDTANALLMVKTMVFVVFIPVFWLVIYKTSGYYQKILHKFRMDDIGKTIIQSILGVVILLVICSFRQIAHHHPANLALFASYFCFHLIITVIPRFLFTTYLIGLKKDGKILFNVLFVGRFDLILTMWRDLNQNYSHQGNHFLGYIPVVASPTDSADFKLSRMGELHNLSEVILKNKIDDVIIVLNENDQELYQTVLLHLNGSKVIVKINAELYPLYRGRADVSSLFHFPLIQISRDAISSTNLGVKRVVDIVASITAMILAAPLIVILIIIIKATSQGS